MGKKIAYHCKRTVVEDIFQYILCALVIGGVFYALFFF